MQKQPKGRYQPIEEWDAERRVDLLKCGGRLVDRHDDVLYDGFTGAMGAVLHVVQGGTVPGLQESFRALQRLADIVKR